jgi:nucleoside-diphosphate-sugar epimerase
VDIVQGTLEDHDALLALLSDCDAVVHCAGAVRGSNLEQFRRINVEGTRRLLSVRAARRPTSRLLLISSLAAREPQLSWYAQSKAEAEALVTAEPGNWCVLRPPAVYGPGDEEMRAIFDLMRRGIALVPGKASARSSLIHVSDLVAAMLACLTTDGARGRVLTLGDDKPGGYDWREIADIAAEVYGRRVRLVQLPGPALNAVAVTNLCLARATGRAPMLTPRKLNELRFPDWVVDNREITGITGWTPRIPLRDGLRSLSESAL